MHSVQLVVEGHSEVSGSAGRHMRDEGRFAVVHSVIHVYSPLTDLHVLETRLYAVEIEGKDESRGKAERDRGEGRGRAGTHGHRWENR